MITSSGIFIVYLYYTHKGYACQHKASYVVLIISPSVYCQNRIAIFVEKQKKNIETTHTHTYTHTHTHTYIYIYTIYMYVDIVLK